MKVRKINELALFAGAGGGLLSSNLLGHNIVCAVERDEFCIRVLIQRQNDGVLSQFPIWDEISTFNGKPWNGTVDLVSGGFPCQAFSTAARGRNIPEKNLWGEAHRVIQQIMPGGVFLENVSKSAILEAGDSLENIGYKTEKLQLSARDLGADHIRERYWLLAYTDNYSELCKSLYAETQELQELQNGVWKTYSRGFRVSNGMAYRMDRLKAIGNGQVPIVAAEAYLRLISRIL